MTSNPSGTAPVSGACRVCSHRIDTVAPKGKVTARIECPADAKHGQIMCRRPKAGTPPPADPPVTPPGPPASKTSGSPRPRRKATRVRGYAPPRRPAPPGGGDPDPQPSRAAVPVPPDPTGGDGGGPVGAGGDGGAEPAAAAKPVPAPRAGRRGRRPARARPERSTPYEDVLGF